MPAALPLSALAAPADAAPSAPDLAGPAEASGADRIALVDALERLKDGVDLFGMPLLRPDARGEFANRAAHVAALRGDMAAILALEAAGADLRAPGAEGLPPAALALRAGRTDAAAVLRAFAEPRAADAPRRRARRLRLVPDRAERA
ncbi:hypothetical protein ACQ5SO_03775 [Rhodovulum sp. DZ06]